MTGPTLSIAVVGDWHQAVTVAACFAELGYRVTGVAGDESAARDLNRGQAPVYEPGLEELIQSGVDAGCLRWTTNYASALAGADFAFVCIDTPVAADDSSDLAPIWEAVERVAEGARSGLVLCISAQVPIGTCDAIAARLREMRPDLRVSVAYVPEFLRLGSALETFRRADRFVVGCDDPEVARRVAGLYEPLGRPVRLTGVRSAEMAKHASNAFLATSISFMNEIANLCEVSGADVTEVAAVMRLDRRIGPHAFLAAGLGYAGGTLGREVVNLRRLGETVKVSTALFDAVAEVNSGRISRLARRIEDRLGGVRGKRIAVLGLTYKTGTSTLRRSAALELIGILTGRGAAVAAFDPLAKIDELAVPPTFAVVEDAVSAARGASALVLVAPWPGLTASDLAPAAAVMDRPVLFDAGNFLAPGEVAAAGLELVGVGR